MVGLRRRRAAIVRAPGGSGLLRNRLLIGGTLGILIGAGTINGLMFMMSLYFQDPADLGHERARGGPGHAPGHRRPRAGDAVHPEAGEQGGEPDRDPHRVRRHDGRLRRSSWAPTHRGSTLAFVLPIVLVAAGMALSNGPCSSISTSAVPEEQVGSASGISNMARYVGAAVMTAIVAAVYSSTSVDRVASGEAADEALAAGFARSSLVLAVVSAAGIGLALLAGRHRPPEPLTVDRAASAASTTHTLPTPRPEAPERAWPRADAGGDACLHPTSTGSRPAEASSPRRWCSSPGRASAISTTCSATST